SSRRTSVAASISSRTRRRATATTSVTTDPSNLEEGTRRGFRCRAPGPLFYNSEHDTADSRAPHASRHAATRFLRLALPFLVIVPWLPRASPRRVLRPYRAPSRSGGPVRRGFARVPGGVVASASLVNQ